MSGRRMGLFLALLFLTTFSVNSTADAKTPRTYAEMKQAVAVQRFANGHVIASSAPFAVVERTARYINGGAGSRSVSVMVEAWPDKPVEIYFLASSVSAVMPTEKQSFDDPADAEKVVDAYVGPPWTKTSGQVLENSLSCESEGQWCRLSRHRRIELSQDMVREIVADEKRKSVSMGLEAAYSGWTIPRAHLIATLDAIGLLHAFE